MAGALTKVGIGREDCTVQGDESYPGTFNRQGSLGVLTGLTEMPNLWLTHNATINARAYNSGALTGVTILAACVAIGTTDKRTLYLEPGTWVIGANVDLSSYTNIALAPGVGAVITDDVNNANFTTGGAVLAGDYQIFDWGNGTGTLTIGVRTALVPLAWFGFTISATATVNDAAFSEAVAAMSTGQTLVLGAGTHTIANITFNPAWGCNWECHGFLVSAASAGKAVTIGGAVTFDSSTFGMRYRVTGLKVGTTDITSSYDHTAGRIGVYVTELYESYLQIEQVTGFQYGIKCEGVANGVSYNEFHLGRIVNNKFSLYLTQSGTGWCNENHFYGGHFNWESSVTSTDDFIHHWIGAVNANHFFAPSFEGKDSGAVNVAYAIYGDGCAYCDWHHSRFEVGTNTVKAHLTATTSSNQIFYGTYLFTPTDDVVDLGTYNDIYGRNSIEINGALDEADIGVIKAKNAAGEGYPVITVHGTDDAANGHWLGNGNIKIQGNEVLTGQGAAVSDSTGAGDVVAQLNTLLARLRVHGLIDT